MITIAILITVILLLLSGTPLFAILAGVAIGTFYFIAKMSPEIIMGEMYRMTSVSALIAIPLFIFLGYYLTETQFPKRMLALFESWVGWFVGGLCLAAIVSTGVFTAFSGASAITIVAFGGLIYPMLKGKGYSDKFNYGLITSCGGPGILLPPSIAVIIYAIVAGIGVQGLFLACIIPALLLFSSQFVYSVIISRKERVPSLPFTFKAILKATNDIKWELPLFIIVVFGVFFGFFTPSEAAVSAVIYALIIEGFFLKEVPWNKVPGIIMESVKMTGAILLIMGFAMAFTNFLVDQEIPRQVYDFMKPYMSNKYVFLFYLNVLLIIVGCVMDVFSAILVVVPLIVPIANIYGIDPYHLGAIFLVNIEIGYLHPPVGINLYVSSMRFKRPVMQLFFDVFPILCFLLVVLFLVTYCPFLSTALVRATGKAITYKLM